MSIADHPWSAAEFIGKIQQKQKLVPITAEDDSGAVSYLGDHVLNPGWPHKNDSASLRAAAVLVPVIDRGAGASVLLTTRNANMRTHSGQVAFPGGMIDHADIDAEHAALREANEEIGLDPKCARTLGRLPCYLTASGFAITPVLALVREPFKLNANPDEVADIFEVPLAFLMNPQHIRRESRIFDGRERFYYAIHYQQRYIWGATAGIIRSLYERLYL